MPKTANRKQQRRRSYNRSGQKHIWVRGKTKFTKKERRRRTSTGRKRGK